MTQETDIRKIRIVIADDHVVLRESLVSLLKQQRDFEVVGAVGSGSEALRQVQMNEPDVLVLDLFMPGGDGFDVLRTLDRNQAKVSSVVLTGSESQNDYVQTVRLGARGLVLKSDGPEKLYAAIRSVANGELAFSDDIARNVVRAMAGEVRGEHTSLERLSERERQIAALVARGLKNKDIGHELGISENTVKRHLQSIFSKTGTHDRLELAVIALTELSRAA
ncbi:MAG TPA: response regulator transcription factor [Terriglobales bacterium]|nr:response regulator transcription factor [Terriglobales bacterium]